MRAVKISDPEGKRLFQLNDELAKAVSPQRWFDGAKSLKDGDWPETERKATVGKIKKEITEMLDGGVIRDYITRL